MSILEQQLKSIIRIFRIVLVMSMIGSGYMALNSLFMSAFLPSIKQFMDPGIEAMPTEFKAAYEIALSTPRICYILMTLLYALSFIGVILMWRLRQNGWHCYTLAQILLLVVPVLFMGRSYLGFGNIMMSALFIGFYFFELKEIRKLKEMIDSLPPSNPENESTPTDDSSQELE